MRTLQFLKGVKCTLFLVVAIWVIVGVEGDVTSCLPTNSIPTGTQPVQPKVPNSYNVKMEVTEAGKNLTYQIQAVVDGAGNRAVVKQRERGVESVLYFYYDTQQIVNVNGTSCTVHNLTSDPQRFMFFGETMTDNRGHIPDGASALYFPAYIPKIYKGRGHMVRGIECQLWHACFSAPDGSGRNLTFDYYFSVNNWTTPSLTSPIPVRYELSVKGSLAAVYEFFDFMPDTDSDPTVFEIPDGVVCPGRISTQGMPALTSHFYHFQEEIIDIASDSITQAEIWYDMDHKLVRADYRTPVPEPPLKTTDSVSVIHDYSYGVSYVKDLVSGQCSPMALASNTFDGKVNQAAFQQNNSFSLTMKDPTAFFYLDSNFTYSGQRYSRNVLCDVYISHRYDLDYYNNGSQIEATLEVYFLADGWRDFSKDAGGRVTRRFPFRMEWSIPKISHGNTAINFFDFDTDRPDISVFDVTDCYTDSASLQLKIHFQGVYHRDREHEVRVLGQDSVARGLQVSPLRVNNVQLQYDASYLYLIVTLLDKAPPIAQFTHLSKTVMEKNDDFSWSSVDSAAACSALCVDNPGITCQSFEFCPNERGGTCRISKHHVSDGDVTVVPGVCDLYSRTVNVAGGPEPTAKEAYSKLQDLIHQQQLYFDVEQSDQEDILYFAVNSEILFGRLENVSLPTLTGQFSNRVEMIFPQNNEVNTFDVWYDSVSKLVRVDSRDAMGGAPYYTPFTITSIHDYNTGISYDLDGYRGNCTVKPIPTKNSFDAQPVNLTQVQFSDLPVLTMKTPLQIFYLDDSYVFTGQKTVRGILCDVFESTRTDFIVGTGPQQTSVFQYFIQSKSWVYEADSHDDITTQQPVQLRVSDAQANEYIIYNFYDYNDEHSTYDNFNIAPCFTDDQRIDFVLDFNHTYHPFLDSHEWQFRQEVQLQMSSQLRVSPVRVQNVKVTYNLDHTYVTATLLGQVSPQLHFMELGTSHPYDTRAVKSYSDVISCASSCYYSKDFICNGFDLCPDQSCYLSTHHVPDGNVTDGSVTCRHFSRLTDGAEVEPLADDAYESLKDLVYEGLFIVIVSTDDGSQQISFPAIGVRDDMFSLNPPTETGAEDLHSKFWLYKRSSTMSSSILSLPGLAVDECATACWHQESFTCNAFASCYSLGDCLLSIQRPSTSPGLVMPSTFCDVYSRLYIDNYHKYPGSTLEPSVAEATRVSAAASEADCARRCSLTSSFPCRSFDFCPSTRHCVLHEKHALDYNAPLINSSLCSHFSRSYQGDFLKQPQKVMTAHDDAVINDVKASTCAYACIKDSACQSFEFCGGQCRLSSLLPATNPSLITDSNYCDLYSLTASAPAVDRGTTIHPTTKTTTSIKTNPGGVTSTKDPPKKPTPISSTSDRGGVTTTRWLPQKNTTPGHGATTSSGGTSSTKDCSDKQTSSGPSNDTGVKAGIGVGALVLGVLLGAGLLLLVQRLWNKQRGPDAMELMPRIR